MILDAFHMVIVGTSQDVRYLPLINGVVLKRKVFWRESLIYKSYMVLLSLGHKLALHSITPNIFLILPKKRIFTASSRNGFMHKK